MKLAIVHDDLMRCGGAEQVALSFHRAFPEAPIFTLAYNPELTYQEFRNADIRTSIFQKIATDESKMKKLFFPFGLIAMQKLDVTGFDVVLISSTYCAKYVKISPEALVINYCHQPFRLVWYPESYKEFAKAFFIKKFLIKKVTSILKFIDYKSAQRTNFFIANTLETSEKIREVYTFKKTVPIIFPPVKCSNFQVSSNIGDYYLIVSRFEYYKKIDLVIEAFNILNLPLIIVGKGTKEKELKNKAYGNIQFLSGVSNENLKGLYSNCKAFIFPQHEDFGITALEANASGRPVIAYGAGGVLNTMIPFEGEYEKCTAVFFKEQTVVDLINAVKQVELNYLKFNSELIRKNALRFEEEGFITKIKKFVFEKINDSY